MPDPQPCIVIPPTVLREPRLTWTHWSVPELAGIQHPVPEFWLRRALSGEALPSRDDEAVNAVLARTLLPRPSARPWRKRGASGEKSSHLTTGQPCGPKLTVVSLTKRALKGTVSQWCATAQWLSLALKTDPPLTLEASVISLHCTLLSDTERVYPVSQ